MKAVLIHEFGHCLDVTRDAPNYGESAYQVNSVNPVDAIKVKDAQSFVEVSASDRTTLWREVFSDVLVAGYWRLSNPDRAQGLTDEWSQLRLKNTKDKVHQTSCWLTELKTIQGPKDFGSLRDWTDRHRIAFFDKCTPKA